MSLSKSGRRRPGFDHDDQDHGGIDRDAWPPTIVATPTKRRCRNTASPLTVSLPIKPNLPQSFSLPMKMQQMLGAKSNVDDAAASVTSQVFNNNCKCHLCLRPLSTDHFLKGHPSATISFDNGPHISELQVCGPCVHTCHVGHPGVSKQRLALIISKSDAARALHGKRLQNRKMRHEHYRLQDGKPLDKVGGYLDVSASHGRFAEVHYSQTTSLRLDETFWVFVAFDAVFRQSREILTKQHHQHRDWWQGPHWDFAGSGFALASRCEEALHAVP